ncbi:NAD(P)H-hydrate dehydratase [Helicobacter sp. 11S03491-1]|uniref:NAD(P)H-hydrate dehydratase n=1 Tax=Helicobacter sp. 11S03491-1 TaxID=1476196 RepID=UPI000BA581D2|nr:NAD(P)H-hydrate dehydratase [Helicobacter sp. 11S03491-1]PAF42692.1 bifunctional ADP-dependent (S)-NAD(P)H-hydrate dehydratase/NAD(P)H-hydrate epimerase [Helicobacter sp. 11S03491-1]
MQNIYRSLEVLDKRAVDKYLLNEDILMENAANSIHQLISKLTHQGSVVNIVCGGGNNGGDGYGLARRLMGDYCVRVFVAKEPKTKMCQLQYDRAMEAGVEKIKKILFCDVVVDCLFGSGLAGELLPDMCKLISDMNKVGRIKIACDVPSGIDLDGNISNVAFRADWTVSMGALKSSLFSDAAKDYVGNVVVGDLGVSKKLYEISSNTQMLEKTDMKLPDRKVLNVHKGNFGHLCVYVGQKSGAGLLSAMAGLYFGAGLVSVMGKDFIAPLELMHTQILPENTSACVIGMGMGEVGEILYQMLETSPCVLDADVFYLQDMAKILDHYERLILTPHPKEFVSLLKICKFGEMSVEELLKNKIEILREFSAKYPHIVCLLKGANTLIAQNNKIYINTFGTPNLSKGGSGDVLAGMIGALVAQGYDLPEAAISASLAHSFAARLEKSTYGLTPLKLIENIKNII